MQPDPNAEVSLCLVRANTLMIYIAGIANINRSPRQQQCIKLESVRVHVNQNKNMPIFDVLSSLCSENFHFSCRLPRTRNSRVGDWRCRCHVSDSSYRYHDTRLHILPVVMDCTSSVDHRPLTAPTMLWQRMLRHIYHIDIYCLSERDNLISTVNTVSLTVKRLNTNMVLRSFVAECWWRALETRRRSIGICYRIA